MKKRFLGYSVANVSDDASFPYYELFRPDGTATGTHTKFPSELEELAFQDMFKENPAKTFVECMIHQGSAYHHNDCNNHILDKVWNRGMGLTPFIWCYPHREMIQVFKGMFNHWDGKHLAETVRILGIEHWKIVYVDYNMYTREKKTL